MKKIYSRIMAVVAMAALVSTTANAQVNVARLSSTAKTIGLEKVNDATTQVSISRYFMAGYNTICLPFSVSADDVQSLVGEGVALEQMVSVNGNELNFLDVTSQGIQAGMPYLIYSPTTKVVTFKGSSKGLTMQPSVISMGGYTMTGQWTSGRKENLYGIPAKQDTDILQAVLVNADDKEFLPTRCSIAGGDATATPVIKHITSTTGTETAINTLIAEDATVDVYTTNGTLVKKNIRMSQVMNTMPKGIYVVAGQKFAVK